MRNRKRQRRFWSLFFIMCVTILTTLACSFDDATEQELKRAFELQYSKNPHDVEESLQIYKRIVSQKIRAADRMVDVCLILGHMHLKKEQFKLAIDYFKEALTIEPANNGIHHKLGMAYGNYAQTFINDAQKRAEYNDLAEKHIRYAMSKNPDTPEYYASLASVLAFNKDAPADALTYINTAVQMRPENVDYLFILAGIQFKMKNYNNAVRVYQEIEKLTDNIDVRKQVKANIADIRRIQQQGSGGNK